MAQIIIDWMEKKSPEWIIAHGKADGVDFKDASLNRKDKEGKEFPGFDDLAPGVTIEATLWTSGTGKNYIFAPRPQTGRKPGMNFDRIIEKKQAGIAESQDRKERSIAAAQDRSAWMWAKNNACELLKGSTWDEMAINDLATKIYNMEPTEPFSD